LPLWHAPPTEQATSNRKFHLRRSLLCRFLHRPIDYDFNFLPGAKMSSEDSLAIFHPQNFWKTTSDDENNVIESAKLTIATADAETLSLEMYAKYQSHLDSFIDMSPNKVATANYILNHISEYGFAKTYTTLRGGCIVVKTEPFGCNCLTQ
jgi:hypothetical protein